MLLITGLKIGQHLYVILRGTWEYCEQNYFFLVLDLLNHAILHQAEARLQSIFRRTFNSHLGMDDLGSEKSPCSSHGGLSSSMGSEIMTTSQAGTKSSGGAHGGHQQRRSRAGRVRTVLTEKQLSLLKSCYTANPRPDALMKEQLVEMTGLSPRVVRVWFQNKRCKDKKKHQLQKSKVHTFYQCRSITLS